MISRLTHNWRYKLAALIVAFALWTYVNLERFPQSRRTITVSIEKRNLDKGLTAELNTAEARVTVKGLKTTVEALRKDDVKAWVDLSRFRTMTATEARLPVSAMVGGYTDNNLEISVLPTTAVVAVEPLTSRRLPVEVKFPSVAPIGYTYGSPTIVPAAVTVSGKSRHVAQVKRIMIALPNRLPEGVVDDYYPVTPLDSSGRTVKQVNLRPNSVRIKMELVEVPATKTVLISPNIFGDPAFPARVSRISANPASVTIEGRPGVLAGVSTISTDRVNIEGIQETVTREVALRLPPGTSVLGRGKARVTVYIESGE